jgi:hypothetical protein
MCFQMSILESLLEGQERLQLLKNYENRNSIAANESNDIHLK